MLRGGTPKELPAQARTAEIDLRSHEVVKGEPSVASVRRVDEGPAVPRLQSFNRMRDEVVWKSKVCARGWRAGGDRIGPIFPNQRQASRLGNVDEGSEAGDALGTTRPFLEAMTLGVSRGTPLRTQNP